jgi:hypothetical protein
MLQRERRRKKRSLVPAFWTAMEELKKLNELKKLK